MSIRIRSITAGLARVDLAPGAGAELARLYEAAEARFAAAGFPVQTRRLVFDPLRPDERVSRASLFALLDATARHAEAAGIRWVCLPFDLAAGWKGEDLLALAPELIRRFPFLFLNFLATDGIRIHARRLSDVAGLVLEISRLSGNGFDNFRVGVGCRLPPHTPFFPFSRHEGPPAFSLAVETIDTALAVLDALPAGTPLAAAMAGIEQSLGESCATIDAIGRELAQASGGRFTYRGMDLSLAPYPDGRRSVAGLMERIAPVAFGHSGTLTATALFSRLLKKILRDRRIAAAGFNGVMYSPLEDHRLAEVMRLSASLTVGDLCLYSTVCGCGVDMVPIPGETLPGDLASLFMDVAALALAHDKPLGIRVLPIPLRRANEITNFNHDFLVNTRILPLAGPGLPERYPVEELNLP